MNPTFSTKVFFVMYEGIFRIFAIPTGSTMEYDNLDVDGGDPNSKTAPLQIKLSKKLKRIFK
jgi:hypothetical protein